MSFSKTIKGNFKRALSELEKDPLSSNAWESFLKKEHELKVEFSTHFTMFREFNLKMVTGWYKSVLDNATYARLDALRKMMGFSVKVPFLADEHFVAKFGPAPGEIIFFNNTREGFASFCLTMRAFTVAQVQTPLIADAVKTLPHHYCQDPQLQTIAHLVEEQEAPPLHTQAAEVLESLSNLKGSLDENGYREAEAVVVRKLLVITGLFAKAQERSEVMLPLHKPAKNLPAADI
ncbi:MAG: hypothetical protein Q8L78_07925 [Coxiellaceae bacterium]|nr:hypothetical protein [Coxiellaceae bacterium]